MLQRSATMPVPRTPESDARLILNGVGWAQYEAIRAATDHIAGLRLTYAEGVLEIMSPSSRHERVKKLMARLIEAYGDEHKLQLTGFGSTTYRRPDLAHALEPDECYVLGAGKETPDLAIEVVVTSGGIDRLSIYRGLGVSEVWFWVDGRIAIYRLVDEGYVEAHKSELLPELDPVELAGIIATTGDFDQAQAVRDYREKLRARLGLGRDGPDSHGPDSHGPDSDR